MPKQRLVGPMDKDFMLDDYVIYNLNRTANVYNDVMSSTLRLHNITTTKWRILMVLADKNPCTVSEIAHRSFTKLSTVTKTLDQMEAAQLVTRSVQKHDRRCTIVSLAPEARKILPATKAIGQQLFEVAFSGVSASEIKTITRAMKKVRENLESSLLVSMKSK